MLHFGISYVITALFTGFAWLFLLLTSSCCIFAAIQREWKVFWSPPLCWWRKLAKKIRPRPRSRTFINRRCWGCFVAHAPWHRIWSSVSSTWWWCPRQEGRMWLTLPPQRQRSWTPPTRWNATGGRTRTGWPRQMRMGGSAGTHYLCGHAGGGAILTRWGINRFSLRCSNLIL